MERNLVRLPDRAQVRLEDGERWFEASKEASGPVQYQAGDVRLELKMEQDALAAYLTAAQTPLLEVVLAWDCMVEEDALLLGDHWERGYGDLFWKKKDEAGVMPWYFLESRKCACIGYGVKVRPGAMCWWEVKGRSVLLHLDVRCGGDGVLLQGRTLKMAEVLMRQYGTEDAFEAARLFCGSMCTDSICPAKPLYGSNNWYYAYGSSSREELLRDASYLASLTKGIEDRPFMVIDDGWQSGHSSSYNGGPWDQANADYGDMAQLASEFKALDVRPGIWFRPLFDLSGKIPQEWRLARDGGVLDISVPEALEHVKEDVRRIRGWGYELIKHDFSTFDLFGRWGMQMGSELTRGGWHFADVSRTSAEIIGSFYRAVKEAAQDVLVLGCNCIGHLGAGLMEANRTGDDTSGVEWERTRKMGVNTLAFRLPQQGSFFAADADCVGITDKIPWEKNRQWMELLAESATPFFVSVKPGTLDQGQEEELKRAYRKAAHATQTAVPLDWKDSAQPAKWLLGGAVRQFRW